MSGLSGVIAPIATPTDSEGRFEPTVMVQLVEHLIDDLDAVFVRGTSGEFPALRSDDAEAVLRTVIRAVDGRRPVIVGAGDTSTPRTLEHLERLADQGASYTAVTTTYYYPAPDAELVRHFVAVADRSPVPVLLYQIPQNTQTALSTRAVLELSTHPNIVGLKDSSGDMFALQEILVARPSGFRVFQGREQLAFLSLMAGADGIISGLGNLAPRLLTELIAAARAGDVNAARALQIRVTDLARIFDEGYWLAALKAALEEIGLKVGPPVPPGQEITQDERKRIRRRLAGAGLIEEVRS